MRGGVCCHRGLSAASVSCSGSREGVVVEKVHAEVRTREALDDCAGRSDDDAVDRSERSGRTEAIEAAGLCEGEVRWGELWRWAQMMFAGCG